MNTEGAQGMKPKRKTKPKAIVLCDRGPLSLFGKTWRLLYELQGRHGTLTWQPSTPRTRKG